MKKSTYLLTAALLSTCCAVAQSLDPANHMQRRSTIRETSIGASSLLKVPGLPATRDYTRPVVNSMLQSGYGQQAPIPVYVQQFQRTGELNRSVNMLSGGVNVVNAGTAGIPAQPSAQPILPAVTNLINKVVPAAAPATNPTGPVVGPIVGPVVNPILPIVTPIINPVIPGIVKPIVAPVINPILPIIAPIIKLPKI